MPFPKSFLNIMPLQALDNLESPLISFSLLSVNDKVFLGKFLFTVATVFLLLDWLSFFVGLYAFQHV